MIKSKEQKKKPETDISLLDITDNETTVVRGKGLNTSVNSSNLNVTA